MKSLYLDESKTKAYTIACTEVSSIDASALRRELLLLRKKGQNRLHFVKESDARRRRILSAIENLGLASHVFQAEGLREVEARGACLRAIVREAVGSEVSRLVLERDQTIERLDRQTLARAVQGLGPAADLSYEHEAARSEPLLWVPDALAWSYVRGGDWRRRVEPMIYSVTLVTPVSGDTVLVRGISR